MYTRTLFSLFSYADKAFYAVSGEGADDEQCETFASHWGGLDLDAFACAFSSGIGDDRLVGIFATCLAQRITLLSFLIASMAPTRDITTCSDIPRGVHATDVMPCLSSL